MHLPCQKLGQTRTGQRWGCPDVTKRLENSRLHLKSDCASGLDTSSKWHIQGRRKDHFNPLPRTKEMRLWRCLPRNKSTRHALEHGVQLSYGLEHFPSTDEPRRDYKARARSKHSLDAALGPDAHATHEQMAEFVFAIPDVPASDRALPYAGRKLTRAIGEYVSHRMRRLAAHDPFLRRRI